MEQKQLDNFYFIGLVAVILLIIITASFVKMNLDLPEKDENLYLDENYILCMDSGCYDMNELKTAYEYYINSNNVSICNINNCIINPEFEKIKECVLNEHK